MGVKLTTDDLEKIIARTPIFQILPAEEIKRLASIVNFVEAPDGAILMHEGEPGDRFYVVAEGQVEIIKALGTEEESRFGLRSQGDFLGEMSLLNWDGRRTASARALGAVSLLEITRTQFLELLSLQPKLAYEMMREMSNRLTNSQEKSIEFLLQKNQQLQQAYDELKEMQAQLVEKERLERELQVAQEIQCSILPRELPKIAGFKLGALMEPARAVGGDFFDLFILDGEHLGVVVGDVSDKGVPAAIFMAQTRALLRAEAKPGRPPAETLQLVNRLLLEMNDSGMFVTVLYGILDVSNSEFEYARAGHELPILLSRSGEIRQMPMEIGYALGIMDRLSLDVQRLKISAGELLFIYTDGVTDGISLASGGPDLQGLLPILIQGAGMEAQAFCEHVLRRVYDLQEDQPQFDDLTVVAIQALA